MLHNDAECLAADVFGRRLAGWTALSDVELGAISELVRRPSRTIPAKRELIGEGEKPRFTYLIVEGWASRYKMLADGRRQMVALLLPGDLCDLGGHLLDRMDHSIGALTDLRVIELDPGRIAAVADANPRVATALWRQLLAGIAVGREWTLTSGQRTALERVGNLFCEVFYRMRAVGMTRGTTCPFPLTQTDLAEATGLTSVHVNRTLQEMRKVGLVVLKNRVLDIPDLGLLEETVQFNPGYLHLGQASEQPSRRSSAPALPIVG